MAGEPRCLRNHIFILYYVFRRCFFRNFVECALLRGVRTHFVWRRWKGDNISIVDDAVQVNSRQFIELVTLGPASKGQPSGTMKSIGICAVATSLLESRLGSPGEAL